MQITLVVAYFPVTWSPPTCWLVYCYVLLWSMHIFILLPSCTEGAVTVYEKNIHRVIHPFTQCVLSKQSPERQADCMKFLELSSNKDVTLAHSFCSSWHANLWASEALHVWPLAPHNTILTQITERHTNQSSKQVSVVQG